MALIRHSAKGGVAVGVRPLRRHEKQLHAGGLIQPQRRGEASIDGRNREGNTIIFGMLRPYTNHNSIQTKAKKALVCQYF